MANQSIYVTGSANYQKKQAEHVHHPGRQTQPLPQVRCRASANEIDYRDDAHNVGNFCRCQAHVSEDERRQHGKVHLRENRDRHPQHDVYVNRISQKIEVVKVSHPSYNLTDGRIIFATTT